MMNVIAHMSHTLKRFWYSYAAILIAGFALLPGIAQAASLDVGVWIPYWAEEAGAKSALEHIEDLDIIYPFVFEVQNDGSLKNTVDFNDDHWEDLFDAADDERVDIIPTLMWFNGAEIDAVLSDKKQREDHIDEIVKMVKKYRFDGVNIDYEQKWSQTIDDFSLFLKELEDELGRRDLTCTIEARMPPEHRWREVPDKIEYANDYEAMNEYCDHVEIMAYDQQRADLLLNDKRVGLPYAPVADTEWVETVIDLALEDFDEDRVMLGVATYGRAWDITVAADWYKDYTRVASLNQPRILELSEKYDSPIGRAKSDEAVITYFPEDSVWKVFNALPTPKGTPKGYEAAAKALLVATYADIEIPVRMVTWSDADSIEEKMKLAKRYDLKGVAVFKVDGEEDPDIWDLF